MRTAKALLLLAWFMSVGCHICTPDGETRCINPTTIETCRDGDLARENCPTGPDSGVLVCQTIADGGSACR